MSVVTVTLASAAMYPLVTLLTYFVQNNAAVCSSKTVSMLSSLDLYDDVDFTKQRKATMPIRWFVC